MDGKDVMRDGLGRVQQTMHMSLRGLTTEQLAYRPDDHANSIAWLGWHLTRVQDHHLSSLARREQAWTAEGWHAKFGKPADPQDIGLGYTAEQVAAIRPSDPQLLVDYHDAVYKRSCEYLQGLKDADMDVELDEPQYSPRPTVGVRLVSVVNECTQHVGQLSYVRGLVEGKRWFPV